MVHEYITESFKIKRLHNIRDFSYKVDLSGDISLADVALLLNGLTDESFFWTEGKLLHSTGDIDWPSLLPEEVKGSIVSHERVKEGYLEQSKLGSYTAFALFAADFNRVLSPNFKANPLFRKLRRRTKEGWNLSLWMKFLHEFSINYKLEKENFEYQLWRWFAIKPFAGERIVFSVKGGIAVNGDTERFLNDFDIDTLREFFAFRVRGSYRVGRLAAVEGENLFRLVFDGGFESLVPAERLVPVFLPYGLDWKEKDRDGFLKRLRLTPKILCKYRELFTEVVNRLLEPYMVKLETASGRWEEVKVSPYVVVDKPVPENEVIDYIFEERKVYSNPFERIRINFVDLYLKSEKNKKLLKDAKADLKENLELFFRDLGTEVEFFETLLGKKVKDWTLEGGKAVLEFLQKERETLENFDLNLVVVPFPERVSDFMKILPLYRGISKTLGGVRHLLLTDRSLKVFYKTQKRETKRRLLFEVLKVLFKANGGSLFVLDEPLPFGRVAVERGGRFEVYNLFGELLEEASDFEPSEEDVVISFRKEGGRVITLDGRTVPPALKRELDTGRCSNAERGIVFGSTKVSKIAVLEREVPFGIKEAFPVKVGDALEPSEALKAIFEISKVCDLKSSRFWI